MRHFNTKDPLLFYSFPLEEEELRRIDKLMALLEDSEVYSIIQKEPLPHNAGRRGYDPCCLLSGIFLAFVHGRTSLREMEDSFRHDIRFHLIFGDEIPDHTTISRFINKVFLPERNHIFAAITDTIFKQSGIQMETCFVDGTKQEAKPNKYHFVWKPLTFHERLCTKARNLLLSLGKGLSLPAKGIYSSSLLVKELSSLTDNDKPEGCSDKAYKSMKESLTQYILKAQDYEEKEAICGPYRNSYYKTDHDATAMCLKQDYYSGLGSNMHAAYSVQLAVSHGFVTTCLVTQERSDMYTFSDTLNLFHSMYDSYPERICADSGYGCSENYAYCKEHGIRAFIKYLSWEGERSGRNPAVYEYNENDTISCLGGRIGYPVKIEGRHPKKHGARFYKVDGCTGCSFMAYCRRFMKEATGSEKIFEVDSVFQTFKNEARKRLLSVEGIEMRVNRSCQVEGVFGVLKQNMAFTRFNRVSLDKVQVEMYLSCLGYNIRKYLRYSSTGKGITYWQVPNEIEPSTFKKPSAKRLTNRVLKRKAKSANEVARDSYKHKKLRKNK